jgi:diguanylate cyclase (GGDEF)-like protein
MPARLFPAILAPLGALVLLTLATGIAGVQLLGAGADLLAEQSRWSVAERDAVAALESYGHSGDERAWTRFRQAVTGNAAPSSPLARLPGFAPAFAAWAGADDTFAELRALGERMHDADDTAQWSSQIRTLHARFLPIDRAVEAQLTAAIDRLQYTLLGALGVLGAALVALTGWAFRRAARARRMHDPQSQAQATLHAIGDAVITTDGLDRIAFMNAAAEELTGWRLDEALGRPREDVCEPLEDAGAVPATATLTATTVAPLPDTLAINTATSMATTSATEGRRSGTLVRRDGATVPVHEQAAPLVDASGEATGKVHVLRDVTRERAFARELAHQATHDGLTGLVNRNEFERQLTLALPIADGETPHALLYFDLDQFKTINDTCGHSAGDALLRRFATQVQGRLRAGDTLARMGGDEFCALLRSCPLPQALEIAEGIRQHVAETRFPWQGRSFKVQLSIGVLCVDSHVVDVAEALGAADQACYRAKEAGRNRVRLWRADDRVKHARQSELHWLARLNAAFDADGFHLLGQRLQSLTAARGAPLVEVLVRMQDERGQHITPMAFIPAAERYGLMARLDRWVITRCVGLLALQPARRDATCLLINLSAASLADPDLPAFVAATLARSNLPATRLGFEINETLALTQLHRAAPLMRELKALGCHTLLDDFGGGMSAFVYLRDLPVDYLKIDGNLVCDMTRDPMMRALVESIHRVARVMGIGTIAEWAEDETHLAALGEIGVDFAQGHGVHRPEPLEHCLAATRESPVAEIQAPNATRARKSGPLCSVP